MPAESEFLRLCRELIDRPLMVFDVGAAGDFEDLPRLAPLAVLHTFEPRADVATQLDGYAQVHRHETAVANATGVRDLFVTANGFASSMLRPKQKGAGSLRLGQRHIN